VVIGCIADLGAVAVAAMALPAVRNTSVLG
jgi:hypothetical protein